MFCVKKFPIGLGAASAADTVFFIDRQNVSLITNSDSRSALRIQQYFPITSSSKQVRWTRSDMQSSVASMEALARGLQCFSRRRHVASTIPQGTFARVVSTKAAPENIGEPLLASDADLDVIKGELSSRSKASLRPTQQPQARKTTRSERMSNYNAHQRLILRERVNGGLFTVMPYRIRSTIRYRCRISSAIIPIQSYTAVYMWGWDEFQEIERQVRLTIEVSDGPHPHRWARKAIETDAASRVGICAVYEDFEPVWLDINTASGVAVGNSFADWLEGKIVDVDTHQWGSDRYPLMGPLSQKVSMKSWNQAFGDPDRRRRLALQGKSVETQWTFSKCFYDLSLAEQKRLLKYQ